MLSKFVIDRFEEGYAIIEFEGKLHNFPKALLPLQSKEGDFIIIEANIDKESTKVQKEKIEKLIEKLKKKNS